MNAKITEYGEARRQLKLRDRAIHKIANVNYTGVKFEDGQWKLHIGVTKKLPEHDKLLNPAINFSGLPLIFDEMGEIKALAADHTAKYRPAPPGISIGHYLITAGTLGVTCFKDGTKYILSNNHVLANCNAGAIGDAILQPGAYDGGTVAADKIGTLAAFVPIVFNDQENPNHVDCALALSTNADDLLDEILELGYAPAGSKEATVGMNVIKSGRTTGITIGTTQEFSGLVAVSYGASGTAYFDDQIITGPMLQGGDSGSCLLDLVDHKAVGLCFAASDVISIANRMTEAVAALGITIFQSGYTPPPPPPPPPPIHRKENYIDYFKRAVAKPKPDVAVVFLMGTVAGTAITFVDSNGITWKFTESPTVYLTAIAATGTPAVSVISKDKTGDYWTGLTIQSSSADSVDWIAIGTGIGVA